MNKILNEVCFEQKEDIAYIFINNAPANKISSVFLEELLFVIEHYILNSKLKGIIVTGKGRHYSSGSDVDNLKDIVIAQTKIGSNDDVVEYPDMKKYRRAFSILLSLQIPVISAINGFCIGSGFELALHSHIRICGKGSIVGLPESTFGFMPGLGGTLRYLEICGFGKAIELVLKGYTFTADEAKEMELVHHIVDKKKTLFYCEELMKYLIESDIEYSKNNVNSYLADFNNYYEKINK